LRSRVRSPESSRFLASCWVMVEPPTILGALAAGAGLPGQGAHSHDYMAYLYGRQDLGYWGLIAIRVRTAVRRLLKLKVSG